MSMISSLIDELNKSADEWNSSNMFELARMCRRAADTISELRGALQVASVDYRHLSDELSAAKHDLSVFSGRIVELDAKNAKLRELLLDVWNDACEFDGFWDYVMDDGEIYNEEELPHYQERMRELGVEVE